MSGKSGLMRILLLSQWFNPEPTFKGLAFAKALRQLGHDVEVLTGFPNYPDGKIYPGYRLRLYQREIMEGIPVVRVAIYPSHDHSVLGRILNYCSFAIAAAVLGPFLVRDADVMYVYHPPATVALPAVSLRLFRGIRFVYDVNDLWPDTLAATGMIQSMFLLSAIGLWCRVTYKIAAKVIVLSRGFAKVLLERGVPAQRLVTIYNWCEETARFSGNAREARRQLGFDDTFTVVFAGTMGKAQALDAVLEAADLLQRRSRNIRFVFVGAGIEVENLRKKALTLG